MRHSYLQKFGPMIVLAYGFLVLYYYLRGFLAFLVNPFYNKLILSGGIVLIALGLLWVARWKHYQFKECEKTSNSKDFELLILLLVPLIFAPIFKPQLLSSESAVLRGVSSDLAAASFDPTVFAKPTDERSLIEWVRILNMDPEPDHYKDQIVLVEGQVIFEEDLPENTFQIGQFVLTCCAADARVIALPAIYNPSTFEPKKDEWIQIKGKMTEAVIDNHRQTVIQIESAKAIPTPKDAYEILK